MRMNIESGLTIIHKKLEMLRKRNLDMLNPYSQKSYGVKIASISRIHLITMITTTVIADSKSYSQTIVVHADAMTNITIVFQTMIGIAVMQKGKQMTDLIERQAAIDALNEVDDGASISTAITVIEELPSAQPEPLTVNIAREMDRETIEKLKESLKNAPVLIMAVNDSAQPERTCENCRYLYMEWADEPCDSCTFENSHWKPIVQPERKKGKWIEITDHETPIVCKCTECGWLTTHYDSFSFCPNCGADMRGES